MKTRTLLWIGAGVFAWWWLTRSSVGGLPYYVADPGVVPKGPDGKSLLDQFSNGDWSSDNPPTWIDSNGKSHPYFRGV